MAQWLSDTSRRSILTICVALGLGLSVWTPASAEITDVQVIDTGPMGSFGGRVYTWVSASLEGVVVRDDGSVGRYSVPIALNYPDRSSNGFGFVDVVNTSDFSAFPAETLGLDRPTVYYAGDQIFSAFLRREGFTYLSVLWNKTATDQLEPNYAYIDRATDGHEILKDAGQLLRSLGRLVADARPSLPELQWVIGHGHSAPASELRGFLYAGRNITDSFSLVFDGFLLTGQNAQRCRQIADDDTPRQAPGRPEIPLYRVSIGECLDLPDHGKIITLRTQSEIEGRGNTASTNTNERVYDVAGVSHIPEFLVPLRFAGAPRQNPVTWQPVAKALLLHLVAWVRDGTEPPRPTRLEGEYDTDGQFHLARDADGNTVGGIRLPHMQTVLADRVRAGAPLGVYAGRDEALDPARGFGFAGLGGTFIPFPPEELAGRYPSREVYVELVRRAADQLVIDGHILPEDRDAYVREAELIRLPHFD